MQTQMIMAGRQQPEKIRDTSHQPQNKLVRWAASFIAYIVHPVFVPFYIICFLVYLQPQFFAGLTPAGKTILLIRFLMMYCFFPIVTVLLAKGLGFVNSLFLKTQKDRIIPYMACIIFYFWMAYVLRHQPEFPEQVIQLAMGIFIASSIGLLFNIYMKISLHTIAMGILLAFMLLFTASQASDNIPYLTATFLLVGLVSTARFITSDHTPKEIYAGLLVGFVSMLLGVWADGILP